MLRALVTALATLFRSRSDLIVENLALRQQLAVFRRRRPRPRLSSRDRLLWIALRRFWTDWQRALIVVRPETVVRWHRLCFRAFWSWRSRRRRTGRPKIDRPHLALNKDAPCGREVDRPPRADAKIVSLPQVGGLHHRYGWRSAA